MLSNQGWILGDHGAMTPFSNGDVSYSKQETSHMKKTKKESEGLSEAQPWIRPFLQLIFSKLSYVFPLFYHVHMQVYIYACRNAFMRRSILVCIYKWMHANTYVNMYECK